jgi:hypothetical protein
MIIDHLIIHAFLCFHVVSGQFCLWRSTFVWWLDNNQHDAMRGYRIIFLLLIHFMWSIVSLSSIPLCLPTAYSNAKMSLDSDEDGMHTVWTHDSLEIILLFLPSCSSTWSLRHCTI